MHTQGATWANGVQEMGTQAAEGQGVRESAWEWGSDGDRMGQGQGRPPSLHPADLLLTGVRQLMVSEDELGLGLS